MQPDARDLALAFAGSVSGAFALCLALVTFEPLPVAVWIVTTTYCLAEFVDRMHAAPEAGP